MPYRPFVALIVLLLIIPDLVLARQESGGGGLPASAAIDAVSGQEREEIQQQIRLNQAKLGPVSSGTVASLMQVTQPKLRFDNQDEFGSAVAGLGDLNEDFVNEYAIGARKDDDGAVDAGAVWIIFPHPDGTHRRHQKISATEGGFTGDLDAFDHFGQSIAHLGDLNGDGEGDIAVGAPLDDDGGPNRGAVWILYLDPQGAVLDHRKISDTEGGFTGILANDDNFGQSIARVGDLNGDGTGDLVVGSHKKDDGGSNQGAVWVLFMNPDETVKSHQKISPYQGSFTGDLDDGDEFGWSVSPAGDVDADGVQDIVVGARKDDDGGIDRGALWVLLMQTNGQVKAHQKISQTEGGFGAAMGNYEMLGSSVTFMGNVLGNGGPDIAVGAERGDDGGIDQGGIWMLTLKKDGSVLQYHKYSEITGGFGGDLDPSDFFGSSAGWVSRGPDGPIALLAGARHDDDGGANRGAVWLLNFEPNGDVASHVKIADETRPPLFSWPLQPAAHLMDPGYHAISGYVDTDPSSERSDYSCGLRTYNGHRGVDYVGWPFNWNKMDEDAIEVIAVADGRIIHKQDGNFDRSCTSGGSWNAVYVEHEDGSIAWYGHLKKGTLTNKAIGSRVRRGEFLGVVGSSGSSSEPHLHLEIRDSDGNIIEPYAGPCNGFNETSWWEDQRAYFDSAINKIMTGHSRVILNECPNPDEPNAADTFEPGARVYFSNFYRDQREGQESKFWVYMPDGTLWRHWTHSPAGHAYWHRSWWWFNWYLPGDAPNGEWLYRVEYLGETYEHTFSVDGPPMLSSASGSQDVAGQLLEGSPYLSGIPTELALHSGYPNPFGAVASIEYDIPSMTHARIAVYDVLGRELAVLVDETVSAGRHQARWTPSNQPPGMYFFVLQAGDFRAVQQMVMAN